MAKAPAFQFYAQDFLTGVMYLTNEEKGIYITMLAKQWTDGRIPKKRLRFLVGFDWDKFSDELKEKFKDCGEYLVNVRLEEEREKQFNRAEASRNNGKKGGRPVKSKNLNKPNSNLSKSSSYEDEDRSMKYEEEKEEEKGKKTAHEKFLEDLEYLKNQIRNEFTWKETLVRNHKEINPGFGLEDLEDHLEVFFKTLSGNGEEEKTLKDVKTHFNHWLKIELKKSIKNEKSTSKNGNGISDEYRRKTAKRLGLI